MYGEKLDNLYPGRAQKFYIILRQLALKRCKNCIQVSEHFLSLIIAFKRFLTPVPEFRTH